MRDIRAIRTEADYDWALSEIEHYFKREPEIGTPEAERFDVLASLIESYEAKHWSIEPADPIDAIRYKMELSGYTQKDLAKIVGSASRASEILNRKRALTMEMVRLIAAAWQIPAEVLITPYQLEQA